MASHVTREANFKQDFEECNKGSDNDVRIFQLVQECQLNGSPACPSVLNVDRHSDVADDSQVVPPEDRVAGHYPAHQSDADNTLGRQKGAEDAPGVTLPHHDPQSQGPRSQGKRAGGVCAEGPVQPSQTDFKSQAPNFGLSQEKCHSRATVQNSHESGQPSPTHEVEMVSRCADFTCRVRTTKHNSDICTVVDTQSGSGAGTDSLIRGGNGPRGDTDKRELEQHDPSSHAVELQDPPSSELCGGNAQGIVKQWSVLADVPACKPDTGSGSNQTSDHPAGMKPPSPQRDACNRSVPRADARPDEHGVANVEHDTHEHEAQDDDLDNFLPTQIDGLENLMLGADLDVFNPAKQPQGEAPLADGNAQNCDSPGTTGILERQVGNSFATLSCVVPDSDDGRATGTSCPLSLPVANNRDTEDHGHPQAPKSAPASPDASPEAQPLQESHAKDHKIEEDIVADQEPQPTSLSEGRQQDCMIGSNRHEVSERSEDHAGFSLQGPEQATGPDQGCQKDADMFDQRPHVREVTVPNPDDAEAALDETHQQCAASPQNEVHSNPRQADSAAAQDDSANDGTVCDSEDAAVGDAGAVESALAPCQNNDETGRQCMSDTIQDTRTQGKKLDGSVPESQQVEVQTVRQQQAPATPVLKQQDPGNEQKTPDLFDGQCAIGKVGVAKLTKSRGGTIVALVKGQHDMSTATGGDPQAVLAPKGTILKAHRSPVPAAATTGQVAPQPRSRGDCVHSKRVVRAQHDARIHKAASAAVTNGAVSPGTSHGAPASPYANPRSRSPSPLPAPHTRTPPKTGVSPGPHNNTAKQRTPSPSPKAGHSLHRTDLGPTNGMVNRSPGPKACNTLLPNDLTPIPASHKRSPEVRERATCTEGAPATSRQEQSPHVGIAPVTDMHRDHASPSKTKLSPEACGMMKPASPGAAQVPQSSGRKRDRDDSIPMNNVSPKNRPQSHRTKTEALHNAVKKAALNAEPANNGPVHVSSTCLVTDSQLSLQNWIETPEDGTKHTTPKKSPPRFPKSLMPERAVSRPSTAAAEDSDDDFEQAKPNSSGKSAHDRIPVTETQREEIEWSQFQQRRSGGKPSHVLDSQNATNFLEELLHEAAEEDIPLIDRAKRKLPQAVGRRVKQHTAAPRAGSGESAGPQASISLKIPRIAVASQQGSQDVTQKGEHGQNPTKTKQGRPSAPAAAKSPVPMRHSEDARTALKREKKSPYSGANRSPQPVNRSSTGGARQGVANTSKSPLRDSGNIPFGAHASAHKWAQDGDGDYKCKADPGCSADRSPRRSARIARHNIVPAADADKALANISQVCRLTQDTSEDPCCNDDRTRTLNIQRVSDHGSKPQAGDRHQQRSAPHLQRPRPTCVKSEHAKGKQTESPSPRPTAVTPEGRTAHQKAQKSPLQRKNHTSADGARTPAVEKRDKQPMVPTPTRSPIMACAKAAQQVGSAQHVTDMQWLEPPVQKTCWKVFYNGFHSSSTGHVKCGDAVAFATPQCEIMLQVKKMWQNVCTEEMCVAGVRLYPILDTPVHAFAPSGVDKKRCLALSDDMCTFARAQVLHKLSVVFVGEGKEFATEAEALRVVGRDPAAFVCRLAVQDSGGAVPLQS